MTASAPAWLVSQEQLQETAPLPLQPGPNAWWWLLSFASVAEWCQELSSRCKAGAVRRGMHAPLQELFVHGLKSKGGTGMESWGREAVGRRNPREKKPGRKEIL